MSANVETKQEYFVRVITLSRFKLLLCRAVPLAKDLGSPMKKEEMVYCLNKAKDLNFLKGSSIVSNKVTPANNGDFKIISAFITYQEFRTLHVHVWLHWSDIEYGYNEPKIEYQMSEKDEEGPEGGVRERVGDSSIGMAT